MRGLIFAMVVLILRSRCGVLASMAALAMERRRDVDSMKAIGGSMSRIARIRRGRCAGFVGGVAGYVLGIALSQWIGRRAFNVAIAVRPEVLPLVVALMVGVALAGALPLRLLGRVRPAEILRGERMPPLVHVERLTKVFGSVRALDGVDLYRRTGEWIAIMGPSGSGKTTLLNLLGCLDQATSGALRIDGTDTSKLRHAELARFRSETVGFVFQQFHLVPHLTALENVMLAQFFHSMTDEGGRVAGAETGGNGEPCESPAFAAFGWRAAARGHRARAGKRSEDYFGRRAHRQR